VVGNPIMHHLLLGIDPVELGGAPFALATDSALALHASELGLTVHPGARVYTLPCIAGHVGADTAGMLLSERPDLSEKLTLLVDVGTNAEIVLGSRERLLACSSPTGPAFEGAQISSGQRAAPGAIERVRIDRATLEPKFKVIGSDVRAIQLAKAALRAGVALLMDRFGCQRVDRIRLAGAFGSHIDVKYAMILGMIPDCDLFMVASAGNAAGTGARIALLDSDSRRTIEELVRRVEKIETAIEPKFQAHFVAAMGIPHSTEAYPELRKVVQLPEPKAAAPRGGARSRRRAGT